MAVILCFLLLILLPAAPARAGSPGDALLENVIAPLEAPRMARLAWLQRRLPVPIHGFASDGCSGGLSAGWSLLAQRIPDLARRIGSRPPWEACCVAHDRTYWGGPGVNGYARRLAADRALRRCVVDTVARQRLDWAARLGLAPAELDTLIHSVAQAMYLAVRVGGGPCTGLPWRWGYGWPRCPGAPAFQQTRFGPHPPPRSP